MANPLTVSPDVLIWARESALASLQDAADRVAKDQDTIRKWEAGDERPTFAQLERLADEYGVSTNVLLLPTRPDVPDPPPDFRAAGNGREPLSRQARRELRRARQLQSLAAELRLLRPFSVPPFDDPAQAVEAARALLGIDIGTQLSWRNANSAFNAWRQSLDDAGLLVLQYGLPDEGLRGLSLAGDAGRPPVVLVNQSDWINSRIFTLLHELGHMFFGQNGAICDPWRRLADGHAIEAVCNRFAGAVLVPGDHLRSQAEAAAISRQGDVAEVIALLGALANRYRVSSQVIWYRIRDLGLVSDTTFNALWPLLRPPLKRKWTKTTEDDKGGIPRWRLAPSRFGPRLVGAVMESVAHGRLDSTRAMRAFGLGTADLAQLQTPSTSA
ncbi:MAG: hypothetical protein QOJ81_1134 [Chloroflexota bacterium]|nr:hypothetical protein [Chloroflexota bacterium]